jgi:fibro-slime domain-containing protein
MKVLSLLSLLSGLAILPACNAALGIGDIHAVERDAAIDGNTVAPDAPPSIDGPDTSCIALPVLATIVRDFHLTHPDFEHYVGSGVTTGIVANGLGSDRTPTYLPSGATAVTTGPAEFAQWYHDVVDINDNLPLPLPLKKINGNVGYDSSAYFPIDNQGFGDEGLPHNFAFTTEIHTQFKYLGGELFNLRGDDDLWLFVNGQLVIDLGGVHAAAAGSIDLDANAAALGLAVGSTYRLDLFQAERHTSQSNFHFDTSITCFVAP